MVSHPSTTQAQSCSASKIRPDTAHSGWHGRRLTQGISFPNCPAELSCMWHWLRALFRARPTTVDFILFYKKIRVWLAVTFPLLEVLIRLHGNIVSSVWRELLGGQDLSEFLLKGAGLEMERQKGKQSAPAEWKGNRNRFEEERAVV